MPSATTHHALGSVDSATPVLDDLYDRSMRALDHALFLYREFQTDEALAGLNLAKHHARMLQLQIWARRDDAPTPSEPNTGTSPGGCEFGAPLRAPFAYMEDSD